MAGTGTVTEEPVPKGLRAMAFDRSGTEYLAMQRRFKEFETVDDLPGSPGIRSWTQESNCRSFARSGRSEELYKP